MPAYHQMGHQSENLLTEARLHLFRGAILSPVNDEQGEVRAQIINHSSHAFEMIFDP